MRFLCIGFQISCLFALNPDASQESAFGRLAIEEFSRIREESGSQGIPRSAFQQWIQDLQHVMDQKFIPVPSEISLIKLLAFNQADFGFAECIEILARMIQPPLNTPEWHVFKFKKILTVEQLLFEQDRLLPALPLPVCAKAPTTRVLIEDGSLFGYFRTSKIDIDENNIASFRATSLLGGNIHVKWSNSENTLPSTIIWESAVLAVLNGIPGVPKERALKSSNPIPHTCKRNVLITYAVPLSSSLGSLSSFPWGKLFQIAFRGIATLRYIHARGFVHRAISDRTVRLNHVSGEVFFADFSSAGSWIDSDLQPPTRTEPFIAKSVFELEGNLPGRRDDLIRFAEFMLQIARLDDLQSIDPNATLSAMETAIRKRKRKLKDASHPHAVAFVKFYNACLSLTAREDPLYTEWMHMFSSL